MANEIQVNIEQSAIFIPFSLVEATDEKEIGGLVKEAFEEHRPKTPLIDPEKQIEIVDGKEQIKEMSGAKAGGLAIRLGAEIWMFVKQNKLGRVYGADTMFTFGKNDRMPDVSFVSNEKIPADGEPLKKWLFAPDLAIEVISPNDKFSDVLTKIHEFFDAGVKQVWLVDSKFETLTIYFSITETKILTKTDFLTCEEILPKFRLKLSEIFID